MGVHALCPNGLGVGAPLLQFAAWYFFGFLCNARGELCEPNCKFIFRLHSKYIVIFGGGVGILAAAHILRIRTTEATKEEAAQLVFAEGSLQSASCSSTVDQKRILEAIAGKELEVEQALRVLLRRGISTSEIRRASLSWSSGAVGHIDISRAVLAFSLWSSVVLGGYFFISGLDKHLYLAYGK